MKKITYGFFATDSNRAAIKSLVGSGADLHEFPPFLTKPTALPEDIVSDLSDRFDWLIFSDVITAQYFLDALSDKGFELLTLDTVRICAVGEPASDVLRYSQIHSDVILPFPDKESAAEPLIEYIGQERLPMMRFLSLEGMNRRSILAEEIIKAGGKVEQIALYTVSQQFIDNAGRSAALLSGGAVDRFIVANLSDVIALILISEKLESTFSNLEIEFLAAGAAEFRFAAEAGFKLSYLSK